MKVRYIVTAIYFFVILLAAPGAFAHTFGAHGYGLAEGFIHPLLGIDHLLAMVAVGIWAVQLGGRALWRVPLTFVSVMAVGAMLPNVFGGVWAELGIASTVVGLGVLIAMRLRLPNSTAMAIIGLFALLHGYAHGLEMPEAGRPWLYAMGFMITTASLHVTGVALGMALTGEKLRARISGSAIALMGMLLLVTT